MSIRLLLIGDCHLREGQQFDDQVTCLTFAADVAHQRRADAVLFVGDIFEGKSTPAERLAFARALTTIEVPVVIVRGNHDQAGDLRVFAGYPDAEVFEQAAITTVRSAFVESRGGVAEVLCVPWPERAYLATRMLCGEAGDIAGSAALTAMLRGMVVTREDPTKPLIILGHLQVLGAISSSAQPLIGKAIEAVLGDLQDLGAAAIVLGHVHKPQQLAPGVEYVGSLTVHDFGEEAEEKRIGLLTVEDDGSASWEWILVPCRRWLTVDAKVEDGAVDEGAGFGGPVNALDFAAANVRYRYACGEEDAHLFDHAEIARRFAAAHTLKIVPCVERAERVRASEVAAAHTAEEKLQAWGAVTGTEITPSLIEKLATLEMEEHHA